MDAVARAPRMIEVRGMNHAMPKSPCGINNKTIGRFEFSTKRFAMLRLFAIVVPAAFAGCSTPDSAHSAGASPSASRSASEARRLPPAAPSLTAVAQQAAVRALEHLKALAAAA